MGCLGEEEQIWTKPTPDLTQQKEAKGTALFKTATSTKTSLTLSVFELKFFHDKST